MLDVLCGVLLLGLGYWLGQKAAKPTKPPALDLTDEEREKAKTAREEWEKLLDFGGERR